LGISTVCDWLIFIVNESNVTEVGVGDVLDENPIDGELTVPLVLRPQLALLRKIYSCHHLRHPTELSAGVDTEKKVDGTRRGALSIGCVQPAISTVRACPYVVLD